MAYRRGPAREQRMYGIRRRNMVMMDQKKKKVYQNSKSGPCRRPLPLTSKVAKRYELSAEHQYTDICGRLKKIAHHIRVFTMIAFRTLTAILLSPWLASHIPRSSASTSLTVPSATFSVGPGCGKSISSSMVGFNGSDKNYVVYWSM